MSYTLYRVPISVVAAQSINATERVDLSPHQYLFVALCCILALFDGATFGLGHSWLPALEWCCPLIGSGLRPCSATSMLLVLLALFPYAARRALKLRLVPW